jgi:RNA polymerase sigma factor (sigma-70 family)
MADFAQSNAHARERADAVSDLFRNHNRMLIRFLQAKLQNEHEAREIAQEAYVRLLELGRTGAVGFLRAYLFKIASNLAVDRLRSRSARERIDALQPDVFEEWANQRPVENQVVAAEEVRVFWACLGELPVHHRQAFILSRLENLSTAEIGKRIGKSDRMVRRYLVHVLIYCRYRIEGLSVAAANKRTEDGKTPYE